MGEASKAVSNKNQGDQPSDWVRRSKSGKAPAGLYLVATPIGNLGDITQRALDILASADLIACEDTRVTRKLLSAYGISTRLIAYHAHSAPDVTDRLVKEIAGGKVVALVSDAGLPLISDPGGELVAACRKAGLLVTSLPGANAALTALQLAGLPAERFFFAGFLSNKKAARLAELQELKDIPATLIFYEAPHRLGEMLRDAATVMGEREGAVVREITKLYEEVRRESLANLASHYEVEGARGEVVVVIAPPSAAKPKDKNEVEQALRQALKDYSLRDAVEAVAAATGVPKRQVYQQALDLTRDHGDQ